MAAVSAAPLPTAGGGSSSSSSSSSSKTAAPGPSGTLQTSEDFIAFDFGDDDNDEHWSGAAASAEGKDRDRARPPASSSRRDPPPMSSKQAQGRKRKLDGSDAGDEQRDTASASASRSTSHSRKKERRQLARGTPWCVDVEFGRCRSAIEMLHDELIAFADWISPTASEHETRRLVIHLIRRAIVSQFSDADVQPFGSQNSQLYLPQGDIDLVVVSPRMESQRREGVLRSMAACLRRHNLATDVQVIAKAKVPIIKFVCTYGKLKVDISVNQTNGLDAARFVCDWLDRCPSIRPLIMATKLLLSQRGMSEVFSGGLGSYSVICIVISHMQLHPKLQRGEIDPACNLGVLFLELLELFGKNFGYDEVGISVAGDGGYYRKAARGWKDDRRPFMLSIEDPQDVTNDIAKGSFAILSVRQVFGGAFDILSAALCQRETELADERARGQWHGEGRSDSNGKHKRFQADDDQDDDEEARQALMKGARSSNSNGAGSEKDPQSLLGTVLGVNYEMTKARRDLEALWHSGSLQHKAGRSPPPRSPEPTGRQGSSSCDVQRLDSDKHSSRDVSFRDPTSKDHRGGAKDVARTSTGLDSAQHTTNDRAQRPLIIDDSQPPSKRWRKASSAAPDERERQAALRAKSVSDDESDRAANGKQGRPYAVGSDSDEDTNGTGDSRYGSLAHGNGRWRVPASSASSAKTAAPRRRPRLDEFSARAPQTFVDDEDDDDEHIPSPSSRSPSPKPAGRSQRTQPARRRPASTSSSSSSRKADFWASKGNAVGVIVSSDDEAGGHDGPMLNIYE